MPNFNEIAALQYAKFCQATSSGRSLPFEELPEMVKGAWVSVVMEVWEMATQNKDAAMAIAEGETLATGSVEALVGLDTPMPLPDPSKAENKATATQACVYFTRDELDWLRAVVSNTRRFSPHIHKVTKKLEKSLDSFK